MVLNCQRHENITVWLGQVPKNTQVCISVTNIILSYVILYDVIVQPVSNKVSFEFLLYIGLELRF